MLQALWCQHNGLPCHVISAKKFQSGYRSPAHMAALSNRCFSFVLLQPLSAQRHRAKEVIHDASLFLVTVTQIVLWVESKQGPDSVLIDFLFCYFIISLYRTDIKSHELQVRMLKTGTNPLWLPLSSSHCLHMICAVIELPTNPI